MTTVFYRLVSRQRYNVLHNSLIITSMMDSQTLSAFLSGLWPAPLRFFERIDSTNSAAARWAEAGAPDLALVVADEQTAGRGRQGRKWFTPAGAALAFSLVLRAASAGREDRTLDRPVGFLKPDRSETDFMRLTALGALAVCQALRESYALPAEIKWPNDVLVQRKKLAGVLVEASWLGGQLQSAILGIGINVAPESAPDAAELAYPATCVQAVLGRAVDRWELLHAALDNLLQWRSRLNSPDFLAAWDGYLAFKGEWVTIFENSPAGESSRQGCVLGLDDQGRLRLQDQAGQETSLLAGELRLRPLVS